MDPENEQGGYGGWMTWELGLDDFAGEMCGQGPYPLHTALNEAMGTRRNP